jgi:hypothetical protein
MYTQVFFAIIVQAVTDRPQCKKYIFSSIVVTYIQKSALNKEVDCGGLDFTLRDVG